MKRAISGILAAAIIGALCAPHSAQANVQQDMATVRSRLLHRLEIKPNDPDIATIPGLLAKLKPDGSFSDIDYHNPLVNDSWQPSYHVIRLQMFSQAYISPGTRYYHNAALASATMRGVAWWLEHDYKNKNWFWNVIGIPEHLVDTCLVFWDRFTPAQKTKAIQIISRAGIGGVSTNLVWSSTVVAKRGILQNKPTLVKRAFAAIAHTIHLVPKQEDGPRSTTAFCFMARCSIVLGTASLTCATTPPWPRWWLAPSFRFPMPK